MSHILRPPSESVFSIADTLAGTPRCIMLLEEAVLDLVSDFRNDAKRQKARDLVRPLLSGCPRCGFHASSSAVRAMDSLLALPADAVADLQRRITDRMIELVGMLKAQAQESRS